ncbi:antitoxin Xre/MbcA/ParS toxin-binding domain-containing protein [Sphingomonas sp. ID0503]|uniref:antitoxin Xre/MbcA/ParS toxin-binding domain-containing protein n=1 Tax=Sphingomonas sp. ID0503 TaxID=3399691 RepID=UPI003AFA0EFC
MQDEASILARFDAWLAQAQDATRDEAFTSGDRAIAIGFILRQAREVDAGITASELAEMLVIAAESIRHGLALDDGKTQRLFGLDSGSTLDALREVPITQWPLAPVERVIVLMESVTLAATLLSDVERACAWFRKPNSASLTAGRSALALMLEEQDGVRKVRDYLRSEVWG